MTDATRACVVCQLPAANCCAKCRNVYYCSREHQKIDWPKHKTICTSAYVVAESEREGRHLIAQRDIKQGEVILQELPIVVGPKLITQPLCLGCYEPVSEDYRCSKCYLPMCSAACEESRSHREAECRLMTPDTTLFNAEQSLMYQFITPLRCLVLPMTDKQKLSSLVSHVDKRKNTEIYRLVERNIVGVIRHVLRLNQYDADSIHNVCGVLDTNSFEIRLQGKVAIRGLYPTAALLNHECVPNTRHVFDPSNYRIKMFAIRDIKKNEKITATYTQSLWNTLRRRNHLISVKHFWCECRRCADPEEFGTMLSALKCFECDGLVVSRDPLNYKSEWKCNKCGSCQSSQQVLAIHESTRNQLKELGSRARHHPQLLESFVQSCSMNIHPSSCHVMEAKFALVQLYGNILQYQQLTERQLRDKEGYCRQLLKLADIIEPGTSRFKGQLEYELLLTLEEKLARKGITKEHKAIALDEMRHLLESSAEILTQDSHWISTFNECRTRLQNIHFHFGNKKIN